METLLHLSNQAAVRDKIARLLQYSCKLIYHDLAKNGGTKENIEKIRNLEYTFGSFRKLLRLGKFIDSLYGAKKSLSCTDQFLRITCCYSKILFSLYLWCDHIIWLSRVGILRVDNNSWSRSATKFWLLSIVLNLMRDYYEFYSSPSLIMCKKRPSIILDTTKNLCDMVVAMTALKYFDFHSGTVGLCGVTSSIAGLIPLVNPHYKLSPP